MLRGKLATGKGSIPALIWRNTFLLAVTQAFVGIGSQMVPTLGAIMVIQLLGTATLAGLATSLLNVSRFLIGYPIGWVADTLGRRAALMIGLLLCLIGTLAVGTSVIWASFPLFVPAMLVFGLGIGAGQQIRLAAADLYPPARRAEGLGYVLTGSLLGALGGPILISAAQSGAPGFGVDPIALAWLLVPVVLIPSMGLVLLVRPDPREIANNLHRYYPSASLTERPRSGPKVATNVGAWISHYPLRVAFVASFAAHGTMTMMMAMTPLAMSHHGHHLPMISVAVSLHVVGMFGLSLPLGRLADRIGRRNVLLLGSVTNAIGGAMVALTHEYWLMTLGVFLVGLGWSCVNVAASALIADIVPPDDRGRAIGTNDMFSGAGSILLPLAAGLLIELAGVPVLAFISTGLLLIPFVMQLRLHESSPGRFDDPSTLT